MTKVKLSPLLESLSGSLKQKNGTTVIFRTTKSAHGAPKTCMYIREHRKPDAAPKKPTPDQVKHRNVFAEMNAKFSQLSELELKLYQDLFKSKKGKLNGKRYATFRGFVIAYMYQDEKPLDS